jgi:hypothetical protein
MPPRPSAVPRTAPRCVIRPTFYSYRTAMRSIRRWPDEELLDLCWSRTLWPMMSVSAVHSRHARRSQQSPSLRTRRVFAFRSSRTPRPSGSYRAPPGTPQRRSRRRPGAHTSATGACSPTGSSRGGCGRCPPRRRRWPRSWPQRPTATVVGMIAEGMTAAEPISWPHSQSNSGLAAVRTVAASAAERLSGALADAMMKPDADDPSRGGR